LAADTKLLFEYEYLVTQAGDEETFVSYLRHCFQKGGFWAEEPFSSAELAQITTGLLPI
jgi:hypothetical protein